MNPDLPGLNNYPPKAILGKINDSLYGLVEGGEYALSSLLGGVLGAGGKLATLGLSKAMTGDADLDLGRLVENKINNAIVRQPATDEGKFWAGELNKPRSILGSTPTSIMSAIPDISTELTDKFINEPMNLDPTSREVVNTVAPFAVPVISGKVLKTINGDVGSIAKSAKANADNYVNKNFDPLGLGIPEAPEYPYSIAPEISRENGFALQGKNAQALVQDLFDPLGLNKKLVTTEETLDKGSLYKPQTIDGSAVPGSIFKEGIGRSNTQSAPSDSSRFALLKNKISDFYDRVVSTKPKTNIRELLGGVSKNNIDAVKQKTGIDLTGYERVIDSSGINHILKHHGDEAVEAKRGQIAITRDDIAHIPEIVESPDDIKYVGTNEKGLRVIRYQKNINGIIYYFEEVRGGKKNVAPNTLYKRKAGVSDVPPDIIQESPTLTS